MAKFIYFFKVCVYMFPVLEKGSLSVVSSRDKDLNTDIFLSTCVYDACVHVYMMLVCMRAQCLGACEHVRV